jgi:tRNA pseudouridine38-40 synthase
MSPPIRTLRLTLAYDGTRYCGWQIQPNGVSLQAVLERALQKYTGETIKVAASGRTDAGVHAVGQVVSFRTSLPAPCEGFLHGLQNRLPDDMIIRKVEEASPGFHARFDAVRKRYRYVIHNSPLRWPFLRHYANWHRGRLDDVAMHEALQVLVGTHDFRCFETEWPNRKTSVRTVFEATLARYDSAAVPALAGAPPVPGDDFVCLDITANGFLYNMVRSIVGSLIHVGRGRWSADDIRQILENQSRRHAGDTAPAQGLYLMEVAYPPDDARQVYTP